MPRIVDYAPAWLSRPAPGASLFSSTAKDKPTSGHSRNRSDGGAQNDASYHGPLKTLARRGTEVFVVVNNQIRWAKLTALKEQWQEGVRRNRRDETNGDKRDSYEDTKRPASREAEEDVDSEPQFRVRRLYLLLSVGLILTLPVLHRFSLPPYTARLNS
jgi:nucleoporin NUP82